MYRAILVSLDGSMGSEAALPSAVRIARHDNAEIHLVHVHVPLYLVVDGPVLIVDTEGEHQRRDSATSYLQTTAKRLHDQGLRVTATLLDGNVAPSIEQYIGQHPIDLVVMTTHGRGALGRLWFGSVADQLVRRLTVPMLLLRLAVEPVAVTESPPFNHVLIPLDGSNLAVQVIAAAQALGSVSTAQYTLLHVIEQDVPVDQHNRGMMALHADVLATAKPAAQAYLDRVARDLTNAGAHEVLTSKADKTV